MLKKSYSRRCPLPPSAWLTWSAIPGRVEMGVEQEFFLVLVGTSSAA